MTERDDAADGNLPARAGDERLAEHVARTGMFGAETTGDTSGYGGLQVRLPPGLSTPRPFGSSFDELADELGRALDQAGTRFGDAIERVVADRGELTFYVRRDQLPRVARMLRDDPQLAFELCTPETPVHSSKASCGSSRSIRATRGSWSRRT